MIAERVVGLIEINLGDFIAMGGPGSGNWRHAGRPGKRGGSAPRGASGKIISALKSNAASLGPVEDFTLKVIAGDRNANLWITPKGEVYQVSWHGNIGITTPPGTFANKVRTGWGRAGYRAGQAFIDTINKNHAILVLSRIAQQRGVKTFAWTPGWAEDIPKSAQRVGSTLGDVLR